MPGAAALLRLLSWCSPAFPTGAFAHSHGLEAAVAEGLVTDEGAALSWIRDALRSGAGRDDAILLRHAHAAGDNLHRLLSLAALGEALAPSRERRDETLAQGGALADAARPWPRGPLDAVGADRRLPLPVALGALARTNAVAADAAVLGLLHGFAASLVSAALRLVPLGQRAAVRLTAALEPVILGIARDTRDVALDELGSSCFRSDIASMRHEILHTRLFRT